MRFVLISLLLLPSVAAAAPTQVLLIGDSITAGTVSDPQGPAYADILASGLGGDFEVTNIGCGGASSLDWTPSQGGTICGGRGPQTPDLYTALAMPRLPTDVATILVGTNDALGFLEPEPVSPELYAEALLEIAANLRSDGADVVLLATPPGNFWNAEAQSLLTRYRDQVLGICEAGAGVLCGPDLFELLHPTDFEVGNIHPNASGHAKIAAAFEAAIRGAVVPEPSTAALLALGLLVLAGRRERLRTS